MTETSIDLRYADQRGELRVLRARLVDGTSWDLEAPLDGAIFRRRCHSWQSVERTLFWLRHHAHTPQRSWPAVGPMAAAIAFLVVLASAAPALAQSADERAVRQFTEATRRYAALHRIIELAVPLDVTSDVGAIDRSMRHLAAALRAERRHARPGDVFTEDVAAVLRARIAEALAGHGFTPGDVLMAEFAGTLDSAGLAGPPLEVNATFPWHHAVAMFPCVLAALPELPPELQYRLVGHALVLVDVHASLIVDVLPDALGATELR